MFLQRSGTDGDAKCANLKTALDNCAAAAVSCSDVDTHTQWRLHSVFQCCHGTFADWHFSKCVTGVQAKKGRQRTTINYHLGRLSRLITKSGK